MPKGVLFQKFVRVNAGPSGRTLVGNDNHVNPFTCVGLAAAGVAGNARARKM